MLILAKKYDSNAKGNKDTSDEMGYLSQSPVRTHDNGSDNENEEKYDNDYGIRLFIIIESL